MHRTTHLVSVGEARLKKLVSAIFSTLKPPGSSKVDILIITNGCKCAFK